MEAVPILNRVSGETWTRFSRSAQPKPSAQTISPPAPTATESPGRFCSVRPARTICRPCATAAAHCGRGAESVALGTSCAFGCSGVAVADTYTNSPSTATSTRPMARTISANQVRSLTALNHHSRVRPRQGRGPTPRGGAGRRAPPGRLAASARAAGDRPRSSATPRTRAAGPGNARDRSSVRPGPVTVRTSMSS